MIASDEELKQKILEKGDFVLTLLCDEPSDLEIIEDKLNRLQIKFVLYCPFDPYNDSYDVIKKFFYRVETKRKGAIIYFTLDNQHNLHSPSSDT